MGTINGKYVAQVVMEFSIKDDLPDMAPFDKVKERVQSELTPILKEVIENEIGDEGLTITVTQLYADVWRGGDTDAPD